MEAKECEEVQRAIERMAPRGASVSVSDIASFGGKRKLCATLEGGSVFTVVGLAVLQIPYRPGQEERAKQELIRLAGLGVTRSKVQRYSKRRYESCLQRRRISNAER